jgi:hypothetical protein
LPEYNGTSKARDPLELVSRGDVCDCDGSRGDSEKDGTGTKDCRTAICAPRILAIDDEAPDGEENCEEDGKRGIANIADSIRGVGESDARVERRKLCQRGDYGEGPKEKKDELTLNAGRIHESEKLDVRKL